MDREVHRPPPAGDGPRRAGAGEGAPSPDAPSYAAMADDDAFESGLRDDPPSLTPPVDFREDIGEQADFRDRFDEDLFTDREDHPAQGNTADVAMGDQRFGSEADAYTEYAWRRPGDHHRGEESAVGQARDPADIADEDEGA